jgi:CBS domain-containing protein
MSLSSIGSRKVVSLTTAATASEVAATMAAEDVGAVVVTDRGAPVGIVTDRDLVLRVMAKGKDPGKTSVGAILSRPLHSIGDGASVAEAAARMREAQVRRLPILDAKGAVAGIVTLDDLVHYLGRAEGEIAEIVGFFPVPRTGG